MLYLCFVRKAFCQFFSFYFLVGSIWPNADFGQFVHLPEAFRHYQLHAAEARASGVHFCFQEFLMEHYFDPASHHDRHDHDELPATHLHPGLELMLESTILILYGPAMPALRDAFVYFDPYSSACLRSPYRPPC